jgi:hypothetical protein
VLLLKVVAYQFVRKGSTKIDLWKYKNIYKCKHKKYKYKKKSMIFKGVRTIWRKKDRLCKK